MKFQDKIEQYKYISRIMNGFAATDRLMNKSS